MDLKREQFVACLIARQAGEEIRRLYRRPINVEEKADSSPVTAADLKSTEIILNGLQEYYPRDGIVSEEAKDIQGERTWYVDPLDGTKGFLYQTGQFAVHIGLCVGNAPVLGVVYNIMGDQIYMGNETRGVVKEEFHAIDIAQSASMWDLAHMEGGGYTIVRRSRQIHVVPSERDAPALVMRDRVPSSGVLDLVSRLGSKKLIFSGGEGIRMLKVAENVADAYIQPKAANTWDVCAPHAILSAAGVIVEYVDGTPIVYEGQREMTKRIYAANSENLAAKIKEAERETCLKSTL